MTLRFTDETPSLTDVYDLYGMLDWNDILDLSPENLHTTLNGSWYAVFAYADGKLVGTGRVVSDGALNAYICGLGVDEAYRRQEIGARLFGMMKERCA